MIHFVPRLACIAMLIGFGYLNVEHSNTWDKSMRSVKVPSSEYIALSNENRSDTIVIQKNIKIRHYFKYMDSIVRAYDSITTYKLSEHLIVRSNSWIIDTLKNTDYYNLKARDSFSYDQKELIALPKGNLLIIPSYEQAIDLLQQFKKTLIDINIPEYTLRIYEDSVLQYKCLVRVGRNEKKYLEMSGRVQDLKTKVGTGQIVTHFKDPKYINPVNNKPYYVTKRDDLEVTKLPQIPFIETEINGIRNGQLIHPTTNPVTIGRAYSNGCIGTRESDAWIIYYHAPIGTKIQIRYDLNITTDDGKLVELNDIYGRSNH